ncbi:MAG TPA: FixH family protein [Vicinamibacterales bacterium]
MAFQGLRLDTSALRLVIAFALCSVLGCGRGDRIAADPIDTQVTLTPRELTAGAATLATLRLQDSSRRPLSGAQLQIQGFMSHPGMAPLIVTAVEKGDGVYEAPLQFTMAGDWILRVTGQLPDGRKVDTTVKARVSGLEPQVE